MLRNVSNSTKSHTHIPGFDSDTGLPLSADLLGKFSKPDQEKGQTHNQDPSRSKIIEEKSQKSVSKTKRALEGKIDLKFACQNVNGFGDKKDTSKRDMIFLHIKEKGDILFFQETHTTTEKEIDYHIASKDTYIFSHGESSSKGVMIVIPEKIEHELLKKDCDTHGRYIIASCLLQGHTFLLVNVYAPNKENENAFFLREINKKLEAFLAGEQYDFIVTGGDWNFTENIDLDRRGGNPTLWKHSVSEILELKQTFDLIDIYRIRNEEKREYTHRSSRHGTYSRIDRFYISDNLQNYVSSVNITPPVLADHSVLSIHIKWEDDTPKGPGFWRLNNDLLLNEEYVNQIKEIIKHATEGGNANDNWRTRYDFLKFEIKQHSINVSKKIAKKNRDEVKSLEDSIIILDAKVQEAPDNKDEKEKLLEAQARLENHYRRIERGLALQAKTQCYEEGEKSSKFFLNQAKQNNRKSTIRQIKIGEGEHTQTITNSRQILQELELFYSNLYTSKATEETRIKMNEWINELDAQGLIPKLTEENRQKLQTGLTKEKIEKTLKTLGRNKTPGSDGITYEFYQKFWPDIQNIFMNQLNEGIEHGELSTSQKQSIIRLIPKKDKDATRIPNWRPLTLGQGDAKIDSKTLACMMIEVMADLIHPNQLAYIKKRFIGEGIKLIEGVIEYVKEKSLSGYMLAVDFLKAFDSYEWEFWEMVLRVFGFPDCFIQLLKRHYKNITSCVVNGGSSTNYFSIKRGVKQGDPPSGLVFILGIELLAIKVRSNRMIEGIEINRQEVKLTAFADDVNNILKNIQSVRAVLAELEKYGEISGLVCNIGKCEAMALGNSKKETITYNDIEIKWVEKMKITGITFGNNSEQNRKTDVDEAISKMKTQLQIWRGRNLSTLGKIQIVKTFGISQILYISNMLSLNQNEIAEIKKLITKFVWNDKTPKVKYNAMISDYEQGGLKYPNFDAILNAQKIMWIKRYFCSPYHPWKLIFDWQIDKIGGNSIFENTSLDKKKIKQEKLLSFYADVVYAWGLYNEKTVSFENVLQQNLFFNSNFNYPRGRSLAHKKFSKKGIIKIRDITRNHAFLEFNEIKNDSNLLNSDYLLYRGIISSIPRNIKDMISSASEDIDSENTESLLTKKNSKTLYRSLNRKSIERPTSEEKLQTEYNIRHNNWDNIYKLPFLVTIDTKTRAFQFKINHNIYFTNKKLYEFGINNESPNCTFCSEHIETLKHLFIDCKHVRVIWNDLQTLLNEQLNDEEKLFGLFEKIDDNSSDLISHITIIVKQVIHVSRMASSRPSLRQVIRKISEVERIEYQIAIRNSKLARHLTKWMKWSSINLEDFPSTQLPR